MRTELAHVLADISGADLQRLLGALPAWVSYPEYERVTWLNTVIQEVRLRRCAHGSEASAAPREGGCADAGSRGARRAGVALHRQSGGAGASAVRGSARFAPG